MQPLPTGQPCSGTGQRVHIGERCPSCGNLVRLNEAFIQQEHPRTGEHENILRFGMRHGAPDQAVDLQQVAAMIARALRSLEVTRGFLRQAGEELATDLQTWTGPSGRTVNRATMQTAATILEHLITDDTTLFQAP